MDVVAGRVEKKDVRESVKTPASVYVCGNREGSRPSSNDTSTRSRVRGTTQK